MHAAFTYLAGQPIALLFLLFAVGASLGSVKVRGVQAGPAAVLFAAIAVSAVASAEGDPVQIPTEIGTLGLVLFAYTAGLVSGPSFFAALRTGLRPVLTVVAGLGCAAAVAVAVGRALHVPYPTIAGTFAGALTNTPALAAATERAGDAAGPTIGYSISYVLGVLVMLATTAVVLRRRGDARDRSEAATSLTNLTVRVEREDHPRVRDVVAAHAGAVTFSRVAHGDAAPVVVADEAQRLERDDLVTVVGPRAVVEEVARELGHPSSHTLTADRRELDFRRITLSRRRLAGHTVGELGLYGRFGATVTRVRRGDVDLLAGDDLTLQPGDRLRVIVATGRMKEVSAFLGDSDRGMADINPIGLATGLTLGVLLGSVHVPLPGGGFEIGAAAGALVVGLVFGRLGRIGPLVTSLPHASATALSQFGMLAFLAYAGSKAGGLFVSAVSSSLGWRIAVLGAVVTGVLALALLYPVRLLHRIGATRLAGIVSGAQTQPAVLAFANERTEFDTRVALGYALVYPAAMIVKIVLAQLIAGL